MIWAGRENDMQDTPRERWQELCEQAMNEPDPERLLELCIEINDLLDERERRMRGEPIKVQRIEARGESA